MSIFFPFSQKERTSRVINNNYKKQYKPSITNDIYIFLEFSSKKRIVFLFYDINLIIGEPSNFKEVIF